MNDMDKDVLEKEGKDITNVNMLINGGWQGRIQVLYNSAPYVSGRLKRLQQIIEDSKVDKDITVGMGFYQQDNSSLSAGKAKAGSSYTLKGLTELDNPSERAYKRDIVLKIPKGQSAYMTKGGKVILPTDTKIKVTKVDGRKIEATVVGHGSPRGLHTKDEGLKSYISKEEKNYMR